MSQLRLLENWIWEDNVTITASSANTDFPVSNLKKQVRSKVWRTTGVTAENLVIDLVTTESVDSFSMHFRADQDVKLSPSATVKLQANATDVWTSPAVDVTLTFDERSSVFTHFFTTDQNYRYWRVSFADAANPYGYIEVSNIILANALTITPGPEIGFKFNEKDNTTAQRTRYGQSYFDVRPNELNWDMNLPLVSQDEMLSLDELYRRVGSSEVIGVALDPTEVAFDKDFFFVFGHLQNQFNITHNFFTYFDVPFKVREQL